MTMEGPAAGSRSRLRLMKQQGTGMNKTRISSQSINV